MSYKTVRELFEHVGRWQKRVEEFCEDVADRSANDRTSAMMNYFAGHERELGRILNEYPKTERAGVLDTWIQHTSEDDVRTFFQKADLDPDQPLDEATATVVEFDDRLRDMYRTLSESSQVPPRVQAVFQNLLEAQEWQTLRNSWSASDSEQYSEGVA
ncbi:hypothetical protein [Alienimonas californiensis]|uniref:DUF2383 domain-containing protein n=1 Tax=Alienimonas californiensis TaxID=2527989 RepID=A0A517PCH3_9PLAN|nr:hypothetical protein [Alienimonas californiensis]QDT17084.1 hypothetical protein CA12_31960 [Alienimonas californiensis]